MTAPQSPPSARPSSAAPTAVTRSASEWAHRVLDLLEGHPEYYDHMRAFARKRHVAADKKKYAAYCHAMLERGILLLPSQNEVMFVSTAHTSTDIAETGIAISSAMNEARSG